MSHRDLRGSMQLNINTGTNTTADSSVNSSRKRRNRRKPKINKCSTSENTTSNGINEQNGPSEETLQTPTENIDEKAVEKMYSIPFMLELSKLPMTQIEPVYLKKFEKLRITSPTDVETSSNTQEMLASQKDFNLRPNYNANTRFYCDERTRVNNNEHNNNTNGNHFSANNTRTEHYRTDTGNLHNHGYPRERIQYNRYSNTNFNRSTRPLATENHFNHNRRSQNAGCYENNNAGSRNDGNFNHRSNRFRGDTNETENETIDSSPKKRTVVHFSLAKNNIVELNTCKNAWVSSRQATQNLTKTDEIEIEEIQKKMRSILNKITPETMIILTKSILEMNIRTYKSLSKIIELLFQKAIDEPNFTPQYAYICSQMKDIEVMSEDNETKTSFKRLIVLQCQETFESISALEKNAIDSLSAIESCKDQALKKDLQLKYEENERNQRKRSVGNCRFMCEMFKVKLLDSKVLEMCVRHLLKFPKEEPLECLCNILKHIGKYLNPENTYEKLREYSSTSYKGKISSRIRFMILDTIDLKNDNWVPRNAVVKPKTLNEIEDEFNMVPGTGNRTISERTLPPERPLANYLNSNTRKNDINDQSMMNSNFEKKEIDHCPLATNGEVDLNTCKNAWVPRFRNTKESTGTNEIKIEEIKKQVDESPRRDKHINITKNNEQNNINEQNIINSKPGKKEMEQCSLAKNSKVKTNTCKNPWIPRFLNSQKLSETNKVELENGVNEQHEINSNPEIKEIEQCLSAKNDEVELNTCKNPWTPRFPQSQELTELNKIETKNEVNEQHEINSKPEIKENEQCLSAKNDEVELNTCKNPWTPRFRQSQELTELNKIETKDSCESFHSVVNSMTQEKLESSTMKLIPRISSIDLMEEAIDVLFQRATTEPDPSLNAVDVQPPADHSTPRRGDPEDDTRLPVGSVVPADGVVTDDSTAENVRPVDDESSAHESLHGPVEDRPSSRVSIDEHEGGTDARSEVVTSSVDSASTGDSTPHANTSSRAIGISTTDYNCDCYSTLDAWPDVVSAAHDVALNAEDVKRVTPTVHTAKAEICDGDDRAIVVESSVVEREAVEQDVVANGTTTWVHDVGGKIKHWAQSLISDPVAQTFVIGSVLILGIGLVKSYS